MRRIHVQDTVGEVVARHPALSRVFEEFGVDYCCGGKKSLQEVCLVKGIDPESLLARLNESPSATPVPDDVDPAALSLTELVDHILQTHHAYLRAELPRLEMLTEKVAKVHGDKDPRLVQVRQTFVAFAGELASHMTKEEQILFPMIRQLDACDTLPAFPCGSIAHPIQRMEIEHDDAGLALARLRTLTDGYAPPVGACNTYRAMLEALASLERDMHQHVHKENNVLFPRAVQRESQFANAARA